MKKLLMKIRMYKAPIFMVTLFACVSIFLSTFGLNTQVNASAVGHNCYLFGGNSIGIGQTDVDYLIANIETPENVGLTPRSEPYMYHLTEDISWEGEFVAPDGIYMAICLAGHTADGVVNNDVTSGGVYFVQCGLHNCAECDTTLPTIQQSFFDAMAKMGGGVFYADMTVALSEDVVLSDEWTVAEGYSLGVCTNGYTVTGGANMSANGGDFVLIDCSLLHDCYYFGEDGIGIGQDMIDQLLVAPRTPEAWGMEASEEPYPVYLYEDITWEGVLAAPDGVTIALCLNGHEINGVIDNSLTSGHIYTMQCGIHNCPILGETLMCISSGYVELMEDMMLSYGQTVEFESGTMVALGEDITLRYPEVWGSPAGCSVTFCTCGYTINNVEYLSANGASIGLVDCSDMSAHACEELEGVEAEYFMQSSLQYMVDGNGVLQGPSDQVLCLLGDVNLEKTLIIPSGMSVRLCLNGFTLKSPQIIWGQQDLQGNVVINECCTAVHIMEGASLTVCDCSQMQTGRITVNFNDMNGLGSLVASAVTNEGEFTLESGSLIGVMALLNAGDIVVNDGSILGLLVGVAQAEEIIEGVGATSSSSFIMNGGEVHSAGIGVVGMTGDVVMNDGVITAQIAGLGTGLSEEAVGDAVLYLNGGTINVGRVETKTYAKAGLPVEDEDVDLGISADYCVGVIVSTVLVLGDDVTINIEGPLAEAADMTAEILMGDGAELKAAENATIENVYEVTVKEEGETANIHPSVVNNIVPADSSMAKLDENGELTVEKNDGTFVETARIAGLTLSLKGNISVNFYIEVDEEFENNPDARVIFMYRGEKTEYSLAEATKKSGPYYVFGVYVSAKDYQKNINCSFTDGTCVWFGGTATINKYLNYMIDPPVQTYNVRAASTTTVENKDRDWAIRMQNYCMAASYHFGISEEYLPVIDAESGIDMVKEMDSVTVDTLSQFAVQQSGTVGGAQMAGVTLLLQSETTIRFHFKLKSGYDISDITIKVNGAEVQATLDSKYYYIEIKNIRAQDLGKAIEVDLDGHIIQYSVLSYAYSVLKAGTYSKDTEDIAKSLYIYYVATCDYLN